jgi:uncharacterized membrane protein
MAGVVSASLGWSGSHVPLPCSGLVVSADGNDRDNTCGGLIVAGFRSWYRSQDATVRAAVIVGLLTSIGAVVAAAVSFFVSASSSRTSTATGSPSSISMHLTTTDIIALVIIIGLIVFVASLAGIFYWRSKLQSTQALYDQERRQREEVEQILERLRDRMSLPGLIELNRLMLTEYHSIATIQAQKSFKSAQRAMLAGFTWLIICFTAVIVVNSLEGKIVAAALAPVGGMLAGFLGRTYLFVYERSLIQLNQYYNQPLLNSYYLAAERLTSEMSAEARDRMLEKVVDQLLSAASGLSEGAALNAAPATARKRSRLSRRTLSPTHSSDGNSHQESLPT